VQGDISADSSRPMNIHENGESEDARGGIIAFVRFDFPQSCLKTQIRATEILNFGKTKIILPATLRKNIVTTHEWLNFLSEHSLLKINHDKKFGVEFSSLV
jgi:hypothetical protein